MYIGTIIWSPIGLELERAKKFYGFGGLDGTCGLWVRVLRIMVLGFRAHGIVGL